jgi:hypothetical protein
MRPVRVEATPGNLFERAWDEGHDMAVFVPLPAALPLCGTGFVSPVYPHFKSLGAGFGRRTRPLCNGHTLLNRAGHTYIFRYE